MIVVDNGGSADVPATMSSASARRATSGSAAAPTPASAERPSSARPSIALLNDDIEVEPGWLAPLLAALDDDPTLGAVQPKLLMAGSRPARINSVGVEVGGDGAGRDIGYGEPDGPQFANRAASTSFTGGAVVFRVAVPQETGGFDDSYFLYYEDLDLARRGAQLGWTYRCVPASVVWHRVSASTSQLGDRARYLQERNRLRYAFRFGDRRSSAGRLWLSIRRLRWSPRATHARP